MSEALKLLGLLEWRVEVIDGPPHAENPTGKIRVMINPRTADEVVEMLRMEPRDDEMDIRVLVVEDDLYAWDAYYATHEDIAYELGLPRDFDIRYDGHVCSSLTWPEWHLDDVPKKDQARVEKICNGKGIWIYGLEADNERS